MPKNKAKEQAIQEKLTELVILLGNPKPNDCKWRRSLKRNMTVFNGVVQSRLKGKPLSPNKRRELEFKLAEFRAMISRILRGESWILVLYHLREEVSRRKPKGQ